MLGRNLHPGVGILGAGEEPTLHVVTITPPDRDGLRRAKLHPSSYVDADDIEGPEASETWCEEVVNRTFHVRERVATNADERRADIVLGLRQLANAIERNEAIPVRASHQVKLSLWGGLQSKEQAAGLVRNLKPVDKDYLGDTLYITKEYGNGAVEMTASIGREEVCKKIEREVEKTVIERDEEEVKRLVASVPEREVTKTVTEVEWECEPLLAATKAS